MSASRIDDGPDAGARPARRARAPRPRAARPGSATAGMPASESRPTSRAGEQPARGARRRRPRGVCSFSSRDRDLAHRLADGRMRRATRAPIFAFSTTKRVERADALEHGGGNDAPRAARPRRATRAGGRGGPLPSRHVEAFGAQHRRERDQRQAHERRRIVAAQAREQADAQALALGAAGAVERVLALEVAIDLGVASRRRKATSVVTRRSWRRSRRAFQTHSAVWKRTVWPLSVAQLGARASRGCRACRSARPSRSATWSEPIIQDWGSACRRPRPWRARGASRSRAAARPAAALSSTSGDQDSNGRPRRSRSSRR